MNIYLNDKLIEAEGMTDKNKILDLIDSNMGKEIIDTIYLDKKEVSLQYFEEKELNLAKIDKIKFETKTFDELINKNLEEAEEYLPDLKSSLDESASLFRNKEIEKGTTVFENAFQGIKWYMGIIETILSLMEDQELREQGNKITANFLQVLKRGRIALENNDHDKFASIIDGKMIEHLNKMNTFNQRLLLRNSKK